MEVVRFVVVYTIWTTVQVSPYNELTSLITFRLPYILYINSL